MFLMKRPAIDYDDRDRGADAQGISNEIVHEHISMKESLMMIVQLMSNTSGVVKHHHGVTVQRFLMFIIFLLMHHVADCY